MLAFLYDEHGLPLLTEDGEEFVVPWTGAMPARQERVQLRGEHPDVNGFVFVVVLSHNAQEHTWVGRPAKARQNVLVLKREARQGEEKQR